MLVIRIYCPCTILMLSRLFVLIDLMYLMSLVNYDLKYEIVYCAEYFIKYSSPRTFT